MKRAISLIVLVACGSGSGTNDASIDGNHQRPDATDDLDHDGILDAVDNCPSVINVNQGNEDGDRFGDACDPCPVVADDAPPDADGDGVADACDPLPNYPGDFIRYFEGFHTAVPAGWEEIGTWTYATGGAITTSSATAGLAISATDRTRETISAAITFDTVTGTSEAGVVDNKAVGGTGIACTVTADPAVAVYATNDTGNAVTTSYEQTTGTQYVVKLRRNMNDYTCTATATASATAMKTVTLTNTPFLSGITAKDATVRFHWFMVVESL